MKPTTGTIKVYTRGNEEEKSMTDKKTVALPYIPTPNPPVIFSTEKCVGCNRCVEVCQIDGFIPNPEKGKPPIILHPDECWYCGCCVNDCPHPGAVKFNWPLQQRGYWRDKETGEVFRLK